MMTGREYLESIKATLDESVSLALCECWLVPESPAGCAVTVWRERAAWSVPWQVVAYGMGEPGVGERLTGTFSDDQVDDCIRAARRMAGELADSTEGRR